jgi:hypothetical protein
VTQGRQKRCQPNLKVASPTFAIAGLFRFTRLGGEGRAAIAILGAGLLEVLGVLKLCFRKTLLQ